MVCGLRTSYAVTALLTLSFRPSLITDLMSLIDTNLQSRYSSPNSDQNTMLVLKRSLRILNEIIKELASVKLPRGVQTMGSVSCATMNGTTELTIYQIVDNLHLAVYGYYSQISVAFGLALNASSISSPRVADDLLLGHLVFKILVKMTAWLWNKTPKMGQDQVDRTLAWVSNPAPTFAFE
jgi:hypothetical protein